MLSVCAANIAWFTRFSKKFSIFTAAKSISSELVIVASIIMITSFMYGFSLSSWICTEKRPVIFKLSCCGRKSIIPIAWIPIITVGFPSIWAIPGVACFTLRIVRWTDSCGKLHRSCSGTDIWDALIFR